MQDTGRIPRWLVENDPSWEKSIDDNFNILKWTKKGTNIQAVCSPTSIFCNIIGEKTTTDDHFFLLSDPLSMFSEYKNRSALAAGDITKYLSSRYLNPGINGPHSFNINTNRGNRFKSYQF